MSRGRGRGEADSPPSKEPDAGPDPKTPRSWPKLKAGASPTKPPRHPLWVVFIFFTLLAKTPTLLILVKSVYLLFVLLLELSVSYLRNHYLKQSCEGLALNFRLLIYFKLFLYIVWNRNTQYFFKILFERERREGEADSPLIEEPDVGLNPRTPRPQLS